MKYIPVGADGSADNLLRTWHAADEAIRQAGARWYEEAHAEMRRIAERTGYTVPVATGITAVISPFMSWDQNLLAAEAILTGQKANGFGHNRVKAAAIMAGADPLQILAGPKVRAFYENILYPGESDLVVVDRHIARLWCGGTDRGQYGCSAPTYLRICADVRLAAHTVGERTYQFQAVIWLAARKESYVSN